VLAQRSVVLRRLYLRAPAQDSSGVTIFKIDGGSLQKESSDVGLDKRSWQREKYLAAGEVVIELPYRVIQIKGEGGFMESNVQKEIGTIRSFWENKFFPYITKNWRQLTAILVVIVIVALIIANISKILSFLGIVLGGGIAIAFVLLVLSLAFGFLIYVPVFFFIARVLSICGFLFSALLIFSFFSESAQTTKLGIYKVLMENNSIVASQIINGVDNIGNATIFLLVSLGFGLLVEMLGALIHTYTEIKDIASKVKR
jgi:hypothetical protein